MDLTVSKSAVWNDDAVQASLDSAAFWVDGLPFVKSLSGYWNFFLAPTPANVPEKFYDAAFSDSDWKALPGSKQNTLRVGSSVVLFYISCF